MTEKLKNIFYVEDDESIAEVTKIVLQDMGGFEVQHYYSGKEAIEALKTSRPQLILMDVMMPDMDGPTTLEEIKKNPDLKTIPVIFMTAKAQIHEQESYLKMGAIGVIVKPFDPMNLCKVIENFWNKR